MCVLLFFTLPSANYSAVGMPCVTIRLSINEAGATSIALASSNLLESTARAIGASATIQVAHAMLNNT